MRAFLAVTLMALLSPAAAAQTMQGQSSLVIQSVQQAQQRVAEQMAIQQAMNAMSQNPVPTGGSLLQQPNNVQLIAPQGGNMNLPPNITILPNAGNQNPVYINGTSVTIMGPTTPLMNGSGLTPSTPSILTGGGYDTGGTFVRGQNR
ncbi:MAG: hypothetical protein AB7G06_07445 [Bdellovibrionales bacterium]